MHHVYYIYEKTHKIKRFKQKMKQQHLYFQEFQTFKHENEASKPYNPKG